MEKINVNNVCHQEFIELILKTHERAPNVSELCKKVGPDFPSMIWSLYVYDKGRPLSSAVRLDCVATNCLNLRLL